MKATASCIFDLISPQQRTNYEGQLRLESEDKVDITPMIDVVFLLLIYFMFLPLQQEADIISNYLVIHPLQRTNCPVRHC